MYYVSININYWENIMCTFQKPILIGYYLCFHISILYKYVLFFEIALKMRYCENLFW